MSYDKSYDSLYEEAEFRKVAIDAVVKDIMVDTYNPKDKRIRDLDNFLKSCMDALVQAGLFDDDSQIDRLLVERREKFKGGKAELIISINILK